MPWPRRNRDVRWETAARKTSGAEEWLYSSRKWCSTTQAVWIPMRSASSHCSTALASTVASASSSHGRGSWCSKNRPIFTGVILSSHGTTIIARTLSGARTASQSARGTRCRAWISRIMRCAACSFENPEGFRFCGSCGSALDADHLGGERRRVTVAFADLVGYSTLAERIDAEELQELITDTFAELRGEVEAREGRVEKFIGDAVVATFGVSPAHEDDPVRAVDAAIAMLEAVQRRTDPSGKPLNLRIGVNSGLVVTNPADGSGTGVLGDGVNVAARLQEAAAPGQVLLAEAVWRRVQTNYEGEHVGLLTVQ